LERKVASLDERVGSIEEDLKNLPDINRVDIRLSESRIARRLYSLETQLDDFRAHVDEQFRQTVRTIVELIREAKK
jgi:hypothetical protein